MTAESEPGPRIWVVDADHWPRAYLRAELIERGYDATGFETLRNAAARLVLAPTLRPAALVVDLRGQHVDERLRAFLHEQAIPVVAIRAAAFLSVSNPVASYPRSMSSARRYARGQ